MEGERRYMTDVMEEVLVKENRRTFSDITGEVMNLLNDLTTNIVTLNDTFRPVLRKEREVTPADENVVKESDSEFEGFISTLFNRINDMNLLINELKDRSVL